MAYQEVTRVEINEVIRRWHLGMSQRQISPRQGGVEANGAALLSGGCGAGSASGQARAG